MADGTRRGSFTTEAALDRAASLPHPSSRVRLLSPFDPLLRDRNRAERLFGFHYRIEIFATEAKRRYGYYVFPVLQGDCVIGRIDARRVGGSIKVRAFWPEAGRRANKMGIAAELNRVRRLAEAEAVDFDEDSIRNYTIKRFAWICDFVTLKPEPASPGAGASGTVSAA